MGDVRLAASMRSFCEKHTLPVRRLKHGFDGQEVAQSVGHSCMPGRRTGHLRRVVRNYDAIEVIAMKDRKDPQHVDLAFINESLTIMRDLADYIPKMQVGNGPLPAVQADRVVNVSFSHFGD